MGRKLANPTPTVINTKFVSLDESFFIAADGQTEQWYYDNEAKYAPNRHLTPLTLTPKLSVKDKDTNISYSVDAGTVSFYTVQWYALEYTNGSYVETAITNLTDSSDADYVLSGFNLIVKKNVSYSHGVTIRCLATYKDPRDANTTCTTQDTVLLTTNRDAKVELPEVTIISPSARAFNPLTDYKTVDGVEVQDSLFDFEATVSNKPTGDSVIQYRVDGGGTEELVEEDGVMTALPSMDIRYPDGDVMLDQSFLYRVTANGTKPNVSGMAFLTAMRGNTVKWNELIPENKRSASKSYTADATYYINIITGLSVTITESHKYYQCAYFQRNISDNNGLTLYLLKDNDTRVGNFSIPNGSEDGLRSSIWNATGSFVAGTLRVSNYNYKHGFSAGDSFSISNYTFIDLTTMFGTDDQIAAALGITTDDITTETGVAAFEAWLETNLGKRDCYPYDAGSLVPTSINAMKSCGNSVTWNQMIDNGGFEENRMTWRGRSTDSVLLSIENGMLSYKRTGTYYTLSQVLITPVPGGHKVYASLDTDYTGTLYASFIYNTNEGYGTPTLFSSGTHRRVLLTVPPNKIRFAIHPYNMAVNDTIHLDNIKLIDLTLLFGEGNEPTTTAEFEEWMTMNELTEDYYPYIAGEEIYSKGRYKTLGSIVLDTVPIPVTQIKGKLNGTGESVTVFPDGMKRAGNVYDEIKVENGVVAAKKRIQKTDLGDFTYTKHGDLYLTGSVTPVSANMLVGKGDVSRWRQLLNNINDSTTSGYRSYYSDGTIYISNVSRETPTATNLSYFSGLPARVVVGHKYAIFADTDDYNAYLTINFGGNRNPYLGNTITFTSAPSSTIRLRINASIPIEILPMGGTISLKIGMFDLTDIFGVGNEPATVADFKSWLTTHAGTTDCFTFLANGIAITNAGTYADAEAFKSAMSGVHLYYELATPQEYNLDPIQDPYIFEWFGISGNQEVKADTLPWYVSGQGTSRLTVDAMFGEHINVVAAAKMLNGQLSPSRAYAAVTWRIPDVDTHVMSAKGGTVRNESDSFTFETICNVKGQMLSENVKNEHLRFNWKYRRSDSTTENDAGWGQSVTVPSASLLNVRTVAGKLPSTHVYPYPFLLGAWEPQTSTDPVPYSQPTTTKDGVTYVRTIN